MADSKVFFYKKFLNFGFHVIELDEDGKIKDANDNFLYLVNRSFLDFEGKRFEDYLADDDRYRKNHKTVKNAIKHHFEFKGKIELKIDKNSFIFQSTIMPEIENNRVIRTLITLVNITNIIGNKEEIEKNRYIDVMTGFFNRDKLFSDLKNISRKRNFTLVLFNFDNLREVNIEFGYDIGDFTIKKIAKLLYDKRPTKNTVIYHSYANEFAMLITVNVTRWDLAEYFKRVSKFLNKQKFKIKGNIVGPSITIGAAQGSKKLFQNADKAEIYAKKHLTPFHIYSGDFVVKNDTESKMKEIIEYAIDNDLVIPYYQPILNLKSNLIDRYETLIRIEDRNGQTYVPNDFIAVAKKTNLYHRLIYKMFMASLYYFKNSKHKFSINFYKEDLLNNDLAKSLLSTIGKENIGHKLIIEIIKVDNFQSYFSIDTVLRGFKAFGCEVAIEDFGEQYSKYKRLGDFSFDYLQISRALIKDIDVRQDKAEIVGKIVSLCKELNIKTIAEYIDSATIFRKVKALGIDYAQGYFISLPKKRI